jgi:hypothetical protein
MNKLWKSFNEKIGKRNEKTGHTGRDSEGRGTCGRTTTVTTPTYYGTADEFYIGVSSDKASTIYLPAAAADGRIIIVKAEMKPPLGNRKVSITTTDDSKIDGYESADITVSHGKMILIRNNGNWFVIG